MLSLAPHPSFRKHFCGIELLKLYVDIYTEGAILSQRSYALSHTACDQTGASLGKGPICTCCRIGAAPLEDGSLDVP